MAKKMTDKQNKVGRPRIYDTPKELQQDVDAYFDDCKEKELLPNVLGFVSFSRFSGRTSVHDYKVTYPEFSTTIKDMLDRCYAEKMQAAATGKMNPTIFIFDAVNNHGMINTRSDNKSQTEHSGGIKVETVTDPAFTDIVGKYVGKTRDDDSESVPPVGEVD
jgi:hypothetical protein